MAQFPAWAQVAITLFDVACFAFIAGILAWTAISGARRADRAQQALIDVAERAQENNRLSANAALGLARVLADLHWAVAETGTAEEVKEPEGDPPTHVQPT